VPPTLAARRERVAAVLQGLHAARPEAQVELAHDSPFSLLIATILSAQCTDERVNLVTPTLFRTWPDAAALARAPLPALERVIRSTGFFRAKARAIQACSRALIERHGGEPPRTMEEMTRLPGVGRKTANVVLGAGYGIPSGIVVDTHMARVVSRLKLTTKTDPVKIERDLLAIVPQSEWIFFSIAMILHGRYVCQARRPRCSLCPLRAPCPSKHLEEALTNPGRKQPKKESRRAGPGVRPGGNRRARPYQVRGRS
jgi:endonuclease III